MASSDEYESSAEGELALNLNKRKMAEGSIVLS